MMKSPEYTKPLPANDLNFNQSAQSFETKLETNEYATSRDPEKET